MASFHHIIPFDTRTPPLFTVRILLLDRSDRPFASLIGAGMGDAELAPLEMPWDEQAAPQN